MQFESLQFFALLLGTLTIHRLLAFHRLTQKVFLLAVSYAFYTTFSWKFAALLAASTAANFGMGWLLVNSAPGRQKTWLKVAVLANLGLLGYFKYTAFFFESLDNLAYFLGLEAHLPILRILLPVGISFYTFQAIAYHVDNYRGKGHPAKNLLDFALFMALFPQLLSGPICKARELLPQIEAPSPPRVQDSTLAVSLILSGLFKRMVMASLLFSYGVADAFHAPENYTSPALWVVMFGYSVQIYCDFSGYTDMMRGFGLLLGFRIPDNFAGPYAANSVGEFWRRWHLTFSRWLREYIYFPLGGSRISPLRTYANLFATMFLCGLWHGASWGYIVWGSLHGLALVHYKNSLDRARAKGIDPKKIVPTLPRFLMGWAYTFTFVSFSRIFFVSADLKTAGVFLQRMVDPRVTGLGFEAILLPVIAVGLLINFRGTNIREAFVGLSDRMPLPARVVLWIAVFLAIMVLRPYGVAPNAYFGF